MKHFLKWHNRQSSWVKLCCFYVLKIHIYSCCFYALKDTYLLPLLLCTKDTYLLQGLTSLKPTNNASTILTSRLLLDGGALQIFCYITCREDGASRCQLFIDGAVGQQLGDSHFIRPAANFSLLTQQSETGHGSEHSIHVDAPQVHEEHHL